MWTGRPACKSFEATYASQIQQLVANGSATLEVHTISILDRNYLTSRQPCGQRGRVHCELPTVEIPLAQDGLCEKQPMR
jgi:hypothetical protein